MKFFSALKSRAQVDSFHREWDRLREEALTPAHRAEIDAIFSRNCA